MRGLAVLVLLVVLTGRAHGVPVRPRADPSRPGCVTAGRHREGAINVHLICHSHDDVGWLKTVDQYYYGNAATAPPATPTHALCIPSRVPAYACVAAPEPPHTQEDLRMFSIFHDD